VPDVTINLKVLKFYKSFLDPRRPWRNGWGEGKLRRNRGFGDCWLLRMWGGGFFFFNMGEAEIQ